MLGGSLIAEQRKIKNKVILFVILVVAFLFSGSEMAKAKSSEPCYTSSRGCFDDIMKDTIESMGGSYKTHLYHLSIKEMNGYAACKLGHDPGGSTGYGPMQITVGTANVGWYSNMEMCPKGKALIQEWTPVPDSHGKVWLCKDPTTSAKDAVECALIHQDKTKANSACGSLAGYLCAYNNGAGWCRNTPGSIHRSGYSNCSTCACVYSNDACRQLGTCDKMGETNPEIPKDSLTGKPNVGGFSSDQMSAANNSPENLHPNCANLKLVQNITASMKSFQLGTMLMADSVYGQHKFTNYATCIIKITGYFDKIKSLLSSTASLLASIILGIVTTILNYVCESIVKGINSLLSMACLSIPSMNFSLSLPSVPSTSCDGLSLLNLVQAQGSFSSNIPYSTSGTYGMSLGLDQLIQYKK